MTVKAAVEMARAGLAGLNPLMKAAITAHNPNANSKPMRTTTKFSLLFTKV
jgi:hypothetical protein